MGEIGLNATSLSHRDIEVGPTVLKNYIQKIKVPVLCANLDISYVPDLHNLKNLKKWQIFEYPDINVTVAVIGFLSPDVQYISNIGELEILPLSKSIK